MKRIRKFLHHVFVPGKHNNHRAHSVSHTALTAYMIVAVACLAILPNLKYHSDNVLGFATDINAQVLLAKTNEQRVANGLSQLRENGLLAQAAAAKAQDMFSKNYWAHFGPSGETPWSFILATGYDYEYAGENLAKNFLTSDAVVDAWMGSPTHKANILNGNYSEVGFAIIDGNLNGEDTTLVVQMFGRTVGSQNSQPATNTLNTNTQKFGQTSGPSDNPNLIKAEIQPTSEAPTKSVEVPKVETNNKTASVPATIKTPTINLLPAYQFLSGILVAFLIIAFVIDLYHISRTDFHRHRGKHIAHLIFLAAALIGIFMIGRGGIL